MINWEEELNVSVKTLFGLEEMLADELKAIGIEKVEKGNRIVHFKGNLEDIYRACLETRLAIRVLVNIADFKSDSPDDLYEKATRMKWEDLLTPEDTFAIDFTVHSTVYNHGMFASQKLKDAIVDRCRNVYGERPSVDTENPNYLFDLHISERQVNISIDASGASLHKRDYRTATVAAPISEVLAAAMVKISGWKGDTDLIDPMCGSGTLVIEAALMARNIPSSWYREKFGFMAWKNFDASLWESIRDNARANFTTFTGNIYAYDRSSKAVSIAKYNMTNAKVDKWINAESLTFESLVPRGNKGVVLMNPPYGERMQKDDIVEFYKMIGNQLKRNFAGWEAWIITSNQDALKFVGLRPEKKIKLFNGPLEVRIANYSLFEGERKEEVKRRKRKRIGE